MDLNALSALKEISMSAILLWLIMREQNERLKLQDYLKSITDQLFAIVRKEVTEQPA
jgi:two-component sensor histidine kinase